MRFIYKIYSGYDGFTPARIPDRFAPAKILTLGWDRYIDVVDKGREVWVYFHGPHRFSPGVYAMGYVHGVDYARKRIKLRVREYSVNQPLIGAAVSMRLAAVVSPRYRQVFVLPEEVAPVPECDISTLGKTCQEHQCTGCPVWKSLPLIQAEAIGRPDRLVDQFEAFVPAYWVIPSRCYLSSSIMRAEIRTTSELFYRFKLGEVAVSFPLALGISEALRQRGLLDFDCIVPIPLSPDKAKNREVHRTRLLARELEELLGVKVNELLRLKASVSKRWVLSVGGTQLQFEARYLEVLDVAEGVEGLDRILLIDDVCTRGSTLSCALRRIKVAYPGATIVAATAGQMIVNLTDA